MCAQSEQGMHNFLIAQLDLSDPDSVDIDAAANEFLNATSECGFVYIKFASQYANTIENLRRAQRAFFAESVSVKSRIAIDHNYRGYLAEGLAQMHGATRTDQKEVFFWGREADANEREP